MVHLILNAKNLMRKTSGNGNAFFGHLGWFFIISQWICFQQLWEIYLPMGREICWAACFHPYSPKIRLWKDNFSRQPIKKIRRTLMLLIDVINSGYVIRLINLWQKISMQHMFWKAVVTKFEKNVSSYYSNMCVQYSTLREAQIWQQHQSWN